MGGGCLHCHVTTVPRAVLPGPIYGGGTGSSEDDENVREMTLKT